MTKKHRKGSAKDRRQKMDHKQEWHNYWQTRASQLPAASPAPKRTHRMVR